MCACGDMCAHISVCTPVSVTWGVYMWGLLRACMCVRAHVWCVCVRVVEPVSAPAAHIIPSGEKSPRSLGPWQEPLSASGAAHALWRLFLWKCLDFERHFPRMNKKFSNDKLFGSRISFAAHSSGVRGGLCPAHCNLGISQGRRQEEKVGRPSTLQGASESSDQHFGCLSKAWEGVRGGLTHTKM